MYSHSQCLRLLKATGDEGAAKLWVTKLRPSEHLPSDGVSAVSNFIRRLFSPLPLNIASCNLPVCWLSVEGPCWVNM